MKQAIEQELLTLPEDWHLHYDYAAGPIVSHFLLGLAEKRIEGRRCPECENVWLPPRAYCERCFVPTTEWVTVGPEGVVEAATVVTTKLGDREPPYVVAFCRLDGASTSLVNYLRMPLDDPEAAQAAVARGTRVKAVFEPSPEPRMSAFHFELLDAAPR